MLGLDGHVKLVDYGLCKIDMWYGSTTATFCGTPEFMAPEILLEQRYGRAVDWWAFGILVYEMILGQVRMRTNVIMCATFDNGILVAFPGRRRGRNL